MQKVCEERIEVVFEIYQISDGMWSFWSLCACISIWPFPSQGLWMWGTKKGKMWMNGWLMGANLEEQLLLNSKNVQTSTI